MEEQASQVTMDFAAQLIALSRVIVDIFKTNDLDKLPEMNRIIKEMYRLQHDSEDPAMQTIDVEANVIYTNFDMLVKVLKTAETDGEYARQSLKDGRDGRRPSVPPECRQ